MAFTSGSLAAGSCCGLDPGCDWGGRNAGVNTVGVMPLKSARMMTQEKKKKVCSQNDKKIVCTLILIQKCLPEITLSLEI